MNEPCPRIESLSGLVDATLEAREGARLDAHLLGCAVCRDALATMRGLRADAGRLRTTRLGVDLSGVIEGRIAALPPRGGVAPPRVRRPAWRPALPLGAAAAAALAIGLAMGLGLGAGAGVGAGYAALPRVTAMAVFDPIAPGGVCIGFDACYRTGGSK